MKLDLRLNLEQPDGHVWLNEESRTAVVRIIRAVSAEDFTDNALGRSASRSRKHRPDCARGGPAGDHAALRH